MLVTRYRSAGRMLVQRARGNPLSHSEQRGLWVVLLGPDGAGKSAVIEGIANGGSTGFRGCDSHHLRPAFLRGRALLGANVDPHGQRVRGTLISLFKLFYLLITNWLAYLARVRPEIARGKLILFDRYFPDCLVDPRRYRLPPSCQRITELIARLIPKPDLYVVLDAPARVLQGRKTEVTAAESKRQRTGYATRFEKLPNVAVVDASRPLRDVVRDVLDRIIEFRLSRYRQRYEIA